MKSTGSYRANKHLPCLLSKIEQGKAITITKRGKAMLNSVTSTA